MYAGKSWKSKREPVVPFVSEPQSGVGSREGTGGAPAAASSLPSSDSNNVLRFFKSNQDAPGVAPAGSLSTVVPPRSTVASGLQSRRHDDPPARQHTTAQPIDATQAPEHRNPPRVQDAKGRAAGAPAPSPQPHHQAPQHRGQGYPNPSQPLQQQQQHLGYSRQQLHYDPRRVPQPVQGTAYAANQAIPHQRRMEGQGYRPDGNVGDQRHSYKGRAVQADVVGDRGHGAGRPRDTLREGQGLTSSSKKDYDAIVRAFVDDPAVVDLDFPSTLTASERHHVHKLAMHFNLDHKSSGPQDNRVLRLSKKSRLGPSSPSAASGATFGSGGADRRSLLFRRPGEAAAAALNECRTKLVDMYQGAQFLSDEWLSERAPQLETALRPLQTQMMQALRTQLHTQRGRRGFHAPQPGLKTPPTAPKDGAEQKASLQRFRERLPAFVQRHALVQNLRAHRVTIVSGDTGCGKTTQIPQLVLDSGILSSGQQVLCTQPRRISALSVAHRVAAERGQSCGDEVGYIIRFENVTSPSTRIVYCTTGILLRRLHHDPDLQGVGCVVVDEVHERDVDTDFALLLLRELLVRSPNSPLKVIVMSATIQERRLVEYFRSANQRLPPLVSIPGTLFRVDEYFLEDALQWLRLPSSAAPAMLLQQRQEEAASGLAGGAGSGPSTGAPQATVYESLKHQALQVGELDRELEAAVPYDVIVKLIELYDDQQRNDKSGAVLVFLPGWNPIDRVAGMLRRSSGRGKFAVHLLHSAITASEQARVFYPPPRGYRKVVLATNVAETSITINDVTFVIDSGLSKGTAYDVAGNTSSLSCQLIAKANGIQRRGRAGRCRRGLCVHLLPKATYDALPDFLPPEILRTCLEEVALQIKAVKPDESCVDVLSKALDAPATDAIAYAVAFLQGIGALDPLERPTNLGRALAAMPVHPALGKMLLISACLGVLEPVAIVAANLGSKSPFVKPLPHQQDEMTAIKRDLDGGELSDHLTVLRLYQAWKRTGCQVDFAMRHLCDQSTLRGMERTVQQLTRLVHHCGFLKRLPAGTDPARFASRNETNTGLVRFALLWSLVPRVAVMERHRQRFAGDLFCWDNKPAQMHSSSVLFKRKRAEFHQREFLVYYDRMRIESQLQIFDATAVSRTAFLLCARDVELHRVNDLSVPHCLDDAECKFGPFDGVASFPSFAEVFGGVGLSSPIADGKNVRRDGDEEDADESAAATEENGHDRYTDTNPSVTTATKRPPPKFPVAEAVTAAVVDHGLKCFLMPTRDAQVLARLRECMDFYFHLTLKNVDVTQFPLSLVRIIGDAIRFPVAEHPSSVSQSMRNSESAASSSATPPSLDASARRTTTTSWMTAEYSDEDDADEALLGGEEAVEDEGGPRDDNVVLEEMPDSVLDAEKLHSLYDAFGDLAVLRRMLLERTQRVGDRVTSPPSAAEGETAQRDIVVHEPTRPDAALSKCVSSGSGSDEDDDVVVLQMPQTYVGDSST